jgi:hypothetical protein
MSGRSRGTIPRAVRYARRRSQHAGGDPRTNSHRRNQACFGAGTGRDPTVERQAIRAESPPLARPRSRRDDRSASRQRNTRASRLRRRVGALAAPRRASGRDQKDCGFRWPPGQHHRAVPPRVSEIHDIAVQKPHTGRDPPAARPLQHAGRSVQSVDFRVGVDAPQRFGRQTRATAQVENPGAWRSPQSASALAQVEAIARRGDLVEFSGDRLLARSEVTVQKMDHGHGEWLEAVADGQCMQEKLSWSRLRVTKDDQGTRNPHRL